jgi:hypothetical protein
MNRPLLATLALLSLATSAGCHRRYKNAAPELGSVQLNVKLDVQPSIAGAELSDVKVPEDSADAVALGAEIATAALSIKVAKILTKAVDPAAVEAALTKGVVDKTARRPPPYAVSEAKGKGDLEVTVTGYGVSVQGGSPSVWISTQTAIYERDGDKVYRASETCSTDLPGLLPMALPGRVGELQAMASLAELKPKEIEAVLGSLAVTCGKKVAAELVKHAN